MESTLQVIPTNSPSRKVQPNRNSPAVLSSIENKGDAKVLGNFTNKLQNIRPHTNNENISKRYCVSQDIKDNFYAIRHSPAEDTENMDPLKTNKKFNNKGRKRLSPDKTTEHVAPLTSNQALKKPRQSKSKKEFTSLYQTCHQLWPESSTLGDFSHDNIKLISDLLKIRLNQAKFKMMAKLDKENELFTFLTEEYVPPAPKQPFTLKLNKQRNRSAMVVVGNNKNLFARQHNKQQRRHSVSFTSIMESIFDSPTSPGDDKTISPHRNSKTPKDRKKKIPKTSVIKTKRVTTPKRRSAAADVMPVVLSDGSSVYVCGPCNKKYKNRNGLAYHMERCKNSAKPKETNDEKESSQTTIPEPVSSSSQTNDENSYTFQGEDLFSMLTSTAEDEPSSETDPQTQTDTFNDSSQLHIWDDFNVNSSSNFDKTNTTTTTREQQWNLLEEEDPFSGYDADIQTNSSWNMSNLDIFNQPPSLLFTETTMDSALDEDALPLIGDLNSSLSMNATTPAGDACTPVNTNTPQTSEGLWFQFANFDNDYQCETDNPL